MSFKKVCGTSENLNLQVCKKPSKYLTVSLVWSILSKTNLVFSFVGRTLVPALYKQVTDNDETNNGKPADSSQPIQQTTHTLLPRKEETKKETQQPFNFIHNPSQKTIFIDINNYRGNHSSLANSEGIPSLPRNTVCLFWSIFRRRKIIA